MTESNRHAELVKGIEETIEAYEKSMQTLRGRKERGYTDAGSAIRDISKLKTLEVVVKHLREVLGVPSDETLDALYELHRLQSMEMRRCDIVGRWGDYRKVESARIRTLDLIRAREKDLGVEPKKL